MSLRVLVGYGTWAGSTVGVAEAIAATLRTPDVSVDVRPLNRVEDVDAYGAFVLGTGIHAGKPHGQFRNFIRAQRKVLAARLVAYFVVCLTMKEDTGENRRKSAAFLDKVRAEVPEVEPVSVGLFGGAVFSEGEGYASLSFPLRLVVKAMARERGDYRDWEAIRTWAQSLAPILQGHGDSPRRSGE